MTDKDFTATTQTSMLTTVTDYKVAPQIIDESGGQKETYWINPLWTEYLGYYKTIPELKKSIDALAMWSVGKGWNTDNVKNKLILEHVVGWGEDTIDSIFMNLITVKKINGDAYAEIIRNKGTNDILINLKPLNPANIRTVVDNKGMIIRYDEMNLKTNKVKRRFKPEEILHIVNDRIANEIHGVSVIEACKWVIDARQEAMTDWRRILHRSSIRVMYVDEDNTTRLNAIKTEWAQAIKSSELLLIPAKRGEAEIADYTSPPIQPFLEWIRYLESFFYKAVGVSELVLGGTNQSTEAGSKISYFAFELPSSVEARLLEQDIFNQLGIQIVFNRPPSLKDEIQQDESKNTGQVGIQPNETQVDLTRNE